MSKIPPPKESEERPMNLLARRSRHRRLSLVTVAAAGLAGCSMFQPAEPSGYSSAVRDADQQVSTFASDLEMALDKVDRERLRAAAEKKSLAPGGPAGGNNADSVILASTTPPVAAGRAVAGGAASLEPVHPSAASASDLPSPPVSPMAPEPVSDLATRASPAASSLPAEPLPEPPASSTGIVVTPMTSAGPGTTSAIITPIGVPNRSPPSAMGTMDALPIQVAAAAPLAPSPEPRATIAAPPADEPTLDQALAVLQKNISAQPTFNTTLALALLNVTEARNVDGELCRSLSEADRKVLGDLLAALDTMNTTASADTLADRTAPLVDTARKWQADADLALPRLVLATRVDSFGVFTPMESRFEQGRRHTVIIYCEVANFASQKGEDGWYTTRLAQQETLITDDGLLVWRPNAEEIEDRSMNRRHDFYLVKKLTIPENLAAGRYTLRMSVTDRVTNKIAMVSVPVEIVAR